MFINSIISFLIIGFSVFMVVRSFNKMKREGEAAPEPEAPPEPTAEEALLSEIRDILRAQAG